MFEVTGTGDAKQCIAWTTSKGVRLGSRDDKKQWTIELAKEAGLVVFDGPPVSIAMAKAEGWYGKNGSKWQTIPDLMLRYRAAAFFSSLYAPELKMGMKTYEEVIDVDAIPSVQSEPVAVRFSSKTKQITTQAPPEQQVGEPGSAAPEVQETVVEPKVEAPVVETKAPEPVVEKRTRKTSPESTVAAQVEEFYRVEANAGFSDVMRTMKRIQPTTWGNIAATDYAGLTEAQQKTLLSGKSGIKHEVKKDLTK
jgi:hypothetical protein